MTEKLTKKVLEKIKQQDITPTPRWQFLLKNYLVWTTAGATLVVGVLAVPVIIHMLATNDWDIYAYTDFSLPQFILVTLPYFWLVFLALCLALVYYNLKHTKGGYRYDALYIMLVSVAVSLLVGGALYGAGLGRAIDEQFAQTIPLYERFGRPRHLIWMQNHHGLLAGTVMVIYDDTSFTLKDLKNHDWNVRYVMPPLRRGGPSQGGVGRDQFVLTEGLRVRALGQRVDDNTFNARLLAPFDPRQGNWVRSADFSPSPHW